MRFRNALLLCAALTLAASSCGAGVRSTEDGTPDSATTPEVAATSARAEAEPAAPADEVLTETEAAGPDGYTRAGSVLASGEWATVLDNPSDVALRGPEVDRLRVRVEEVDLESLPNVPSFVKHAVAVYVDREVAQGDRTGSSNPYTDPMLGFDVVASTAEMSLDQGGSIFKLVVPGRPCVLENQRVELTQGVAVSGCFYLGIPGAGEFTDPPEGPFMLRWRPGGGPSNGGYDFFWSDRLLEPRR